MPPEVLRLGPDHPESLGWLWRTWGTTQMLRHMAVVDGFPRRDDPPAVPALCLSFWTADRSPWRVLEQIRAG